MNSPVPACRAKDLDLRDTTSVRAAISDPLDAVVHLAALASGAEARRDPGMAWDVNAGGTARLADGLAEAKASGQGDPLLLLVSTAEVYGNVAPPRARTEADPPAPCSPYAASKLGAEVAALEAARRSLLRVVVVRTFPHTGPGQTDRYVVPAFARRLLAAKRLGAPVVKTGNLEPVRDFLDVRDVVDAYARLLQHGQSGAVYNVASGQGYSLKDIFLRLADIVGVRATPEVDSGLVRPADISHLVGDASLLQSVTGWTPALSFDQTLRDVVHAQAD